MTSTVGATSRYPKLSFNKEYIWFLPLVDIASVMQYLERWKAFTLQGYLNSGIYNLFEDLYT